MTLPKPTTYKRATRLTEAERRMRAKNEAVSILNSMLGHLHYEYRALDGVPFTRPTSNSTELVHVSADPPAHVFELLTDWDADADPDLDGSGDDECEMEHDHEREEYL